MDLVADDRHNTSKVATTVSTWRQWTKEGLAVGSLPETRKPQQQLYNSNTITWTGGSRPWGVACRLAELASNRPQELWATLQVPHNQVVPVACRLGQVWVT